MRSSFTKIFRNSLLLVIVISLSDCFTLMFTLSLSSSANTVIFAIPTPAALSVLPSTKTTAGLFEVMRTSFSVSSGGNVNFTVLSSPSSYHSACSSSLLAICNTVAEEYLSSSFSPQAARAIENDKHITTVSTINQRLFFFITFPPKHIFYRYISIWERH